MADFRFVLFVFFLLVTFASACMTHFYSTVAHTNPASELFINLGILGLLSGFVGMLVSLVLW